MRRLARSLKQLIETVEDLGDRGIGLRSLSDELRVQMELGTRANDSSLTELVRRALREFLDRRPSKSWGQPRAQRPDGEAS